MSKTRHTQFLRFAITLSAALAAFGLAPVKAFAESNSLQEQIEAVQEICADMADAARERAQPLPEGEVKLLKACVMATEGFAAWRAEGETKWATAKVHDILLPGAEIMTGRDGSMCLRVGQNATVLVDRLAKLALPEIVQDGATLRTALAVQRGRAGIKVDRVGLTNDASVITPTATMGVQGTGFAVKYGGFDGTEIAAARLNEMHAIEVHYFTNLFTYSLSGGATSGDRNRDPVVAELFDTIGPSPLISAIIEADATPAQLANALTMNPVGEGRRVEINRSGFRNTMGLRNADAAQFVCENLKSVFGVYAKLLIENGLGTRSMTDPQNDLRSLCLDVDQFEDAHLQEIVSTIKAYCESVHTSPADIAACRTLFGAAVRSIPNN